MDNPLRKTEVKPEPRKPKKEKTKPVGIALKESEWQTIDKIAGDVNLNRHKLVLWVLRDFIKRYEAGEVVTVNKKTLPQP
jgi:hypothetical protein